VSRTWRWPRAGGPVSARRPRLRLAGALLGVALLGAWTAAPARGQVRPPAAPAAAQLDLARDTAYVEAIVRLEIDGGPSDVVSALVHDSTLLVPLRQFLTMAEVRVAAFAPGDSALVVLEPGHVLVRFRPGAHLLTRGAESVAYDSAGAVWWDGDLFVATGLLDRLLGVATSIEWPDLAVVVGRAAGLPVMRRARREQRQQLLARAPQAPAGVLEIPLRDRTVDGAVLSWSLTASSGGPTEQFALDLGLGAGLVGGSVEVRPEVWRGPGASGTGLRTSWSRVWPRSRWLQQLRLGDVQTSGIQSRLVQGLVVTNAPFIRSSQFAIEPFRGSVPAGWEVELYDGGRLLAYSEADALGMFRVPLQLRYGQNPFELVLYGPSGEVVRQRRTIRVPFSRLPARRLEYAVGAGACRFEPCRGMVSADARYGVSDRVTVQGGWETFFRDELGSVWQPYAVASAAPLPSLAVTGEAVVNGHVRAAVEFEPNTDLHVAGGVTRFAVSGGVFSGSVSETSRSEATLFWRPGWMQGAMFFQGSGARSVGPSLQRSVARFAATTRYRLVRLSLGVLLDELRSGSAAARRSLSFDVGADANLLGPRPWLRSATVQGQLAVDPSRGLTALRAALGRRVANAFRVDGGVGWYRTSGLSLELNLSTSMPGPRAGVRSRVSSEAGSQALTFAYGSMAWDPRSQLVRLGDGADLGRAGLSGELFRDDNGNGRRDPGEPGLADIPVTVGGWPATTDADGRFTVWGLVPTEPVHVDVDTLSFADPHFVLPAAVIQVRPSPNAFGTIVVPVAVGGEVSGFVVLGEEAIGGAPVVLRELTSGAEITILTFADGAFYRGAVPPGEYEVTLPDAVLERLHAYAPPLTIFIPPGAGEKRFEDLQLRLEPRS